MYLVIFQILNINLIFLLIMVYAGLVITESMILPTFSLSKPLEIEGIKLDPLRVSKRVYDIHGNDMDFRW